MVTYSTNITSIEFGRVQDTLRTGLFTDDDVFVYEYISIWKFYLQKYLCNETITAATRINGFTGIFNLFPDGHVYRLHWELQIYRGLESRREQVGKWLSTSGLEMISRPDTPRPFSASLEEVRFNPFRIATFITPPFVSFKPDVEQEAPLNERLTGVYIELCKLLLDRLGITNYEFVLQPDGSSGTLVNGVWSGLMGTISQGRAHLGCAPITVLAARRQAVKFSQVIHTAPLSILYKRQATDASQEIFRFLQPMEAAIWLGVLGLLLCFSAVLVALYRANPDQSVTLSLYNSVFFCLSEAVQGNTSLAPSSVSCRIAVSCFWFFTILLFLAYAANTAAFRLLVAEDSQPDSLEALVQSDRYEFCIVKNGAIMSIMRESVNVHAQQAYALMTERFSNGLVDSVSTAVDIILNSSTQFALIADSLQNAYLQDTNCRLASSGSFYWLKSAMIMPPDSEFADHLDAEIVNLAYQIASLQSQPVEAHQLQRPDCSDQSLLGRLLASLPAEPWPVKADSLGLSSSLGLVLVNLVGCLLALVISGVEFGCGRLLKRRSDRRRAEQTAQALAATRRSNFQSLRPDEQ